ncbi:MAG: hypothetical protein EXR29_10205 [Betaproteobacteria bacterium]|nr:hypothetical protein [Betaproteobacteria bacterium]
MIDTYTHTFAVNQVSSSSTATSAAVATKIAFNPPDVGKTGAVYVTAIAPEGSLAATPGDTTARGVTRASAASARATTSAPAFVLYQLTSSGWQLVVNGVLIPYASGVLGDQLAAQSILNNTDPTNLKGAQFCLGYGTSASEMTAAGEMVFLRAQPRSRRWQRAHRLHYQQDLPRLHGEQQTTRAGRGLLGGQVALTAQSPTRKTIGRATGPIFI